jgi:hypothetical protein
MFLGAMVRPIVVVRNTVTSSSSFFLLSLGDSPFFSTSFFSSGFSSSSFFSASFSLSFVSSVLF